MARRGAAPRPVRSRVLVTGASGGIGAATVAALRARGARVLGLDLAAGDDVLACDVCDQDAVDAAVSTCVERLGGLDAVINAAGIGLPQSAALPPGEDARRVLEVNLLGTWRVTAAALPHLRTSGGRVINVASGLVHIAFPFATAYGASKRAVVGYSDQLRAEVGDEVTVTTVYPGYVRTPIHDVARGAGLDLGAVVPEEPLSAVATTLVRAVLGAPARDLATTRTGAASYAALRLAPRGLADRIVRRRVHAAVRAGRLGDGSLTVAPSPHVSATHRPAASSQSLTTTEGDET